MNAKNKHTDFDAGFTSWILRAETYEGKANGHGRAQTDQKKSPVEKLYEGGYRAALAWEKRERARLALDEPLLDC